MKNPASAGARRGAEGTLLRRRPRRPDAGPGPGRWPTAAPRRGRPPPPSGARRGSRASGRGRGVPHALPSPRVNMAPGPPGRAAGPLIPSEEPRRERGGPGGADAWLRLPGRTRTPSSVGPGREELERAAGGRAGARCVCVAFSLGGCRRTPPPVPRRRASEREKRL